MPVLVRVAAILRATTPEVPAPVVATLPEQAASSSTAAAKRVRIQPVRHRGDRLGLLAQEIRRRSVVGCHPGQDSRHSGYSLGSAASSARASGVRAAMTGDLGSVSSGAPSGSS